MGGLHAIEGSYGLPADLLAETQALIAETVAEGGIDILPTVPDPLEAQIVMRRETPTVLRAVQGSGRLATGGQVYMPTPYGDLRRAA